MIEQIEVQDCSGQTDLDAMTDEELQAAIQRLSTQIEEQKAHRPAQCGWMEQIEWEAALCCAIYQCESLRFVLIYRGIDHLLGRVHISPRRLH